MKTPLLLERHEVTALLDHFNAKEDENGGTALETCFVVRLCKQTQELMAQADSDAVLIRELFEALLGLANPPRLITSLFDEVNRRLEGSWRAYEPREVGAIKAIIEKRNAAPAATT